jgi:hypothetical protein
MRILATISGAVAQVPDGARWSFGDRDRKRSTNTIRHNADDSALRELDESVPGTARVIPAQKDGSRPTGKPERYNWKRAITSLANSSVRASMSATVQDSFAANDELREKPLR